MGDQFVTVTVTRPPHRPLWVMGLGSYGWLFLLGLFATGAAVNLGVGHYNDAYLQLVMLWAFGSVRWYSRTWDHG